MIKLTVTNRTQCDQVKAICEASNAEERHFVQAANFHIVDAAAALRTAGAKNDEAVRTQQSEAKKAPTTLLDDKGKPFATGIYEIQQLAEKSNARRQRIVAKGEQDSRRSVKSEESKVQQLADARAEAARRKIIGQNEKKGQREDKDQTEQSES